MKCVSISFIGLCMFAISLLVHCTSTLFNNTLLCKHHCMLWCCVRVTFTFDLHVLFSFGEFSSTLSPSIQWFPLYLIFEHAHFQLTGVLTIHVVMKRSPRNTADVDLA